MTKKQKLKAIDCCRDLIDVYSKLKELSAQTNNDNIKIALALIDKATDLLSEV